MRTLSALLALVFALNISPVQPTPVLAADGGEQHASRLAGDNDIVLFNTNSKKYHSQSCMHLRNCTHCVKKKRSEAKAEGGIPCKTCGGGEND